MRPQLLAAIAALMPLTTAALAQSVTINGGGATSSQPSYDAEFTNYTNANPSVLFSYDGVGSTGQTAFLTNNISLFNKASSQYGTIVGSTVHFAASDFPLSSSQVSGYTLSSTDGPLIQIPTIGVGVTIPFVNAKLTTLKLTDDQLCGVLSGRITAWQTLSTKATAGTIAVIYRSDTSAASELVTQHLNAVCTSANSSFPTLPVPITNAFNTVFTTSGGSVPPNFTGVSGSSGMQSALLATSLSLGYISPDYTSIAPKSANTSSLLVASLVNASNSVAYTPTVKNIALGLTSPGAGSTDPTPPTTKSAAANPLNWVPQVPAPTKGYPIVGYSSWDLSSCYANTAIGADLIDFLKSTNSSAAYKTIVTNNGGTPLANTKAAKFVTSINAVFLGNSSKYNLNIDNATACKGLAGR